MSVPVVGLDNVFATRAGPDPIPYSSAGSGPPMIGFTFATCVAPDSNSAFAARVLIIPVALVPVHTTPASTIEALPVPAACSPTDSEYVSFLPGNPLTPVLDPG